MVDYAASDDFIVELCTELIIERFVAFWSHERKASLGDGMVDIGIDAGKGIYDTADACSNQYVEPHRSRGLGSVWT